MSAICATLPAYGQQAAPPAVPVGVVQAATVLALALFDVPRTEALSFSLLMHASQFLPVTAVGLVFLFLEHVRLTDATRVDVGRIASSER